MRPIDQNIINELKSRELRPFSLLYMGLPDANLRYTDADVPIPVAEAAKGEALTTTDGTILTTTSGEQLHTSEASVTLYYPRGFEAQAISYSAAQIVDRARLTIDNLDDMFTSAFIGGTPQGAGVTVSLVVLDAGYKVIVEPVTLFQGVIDSWQIRQEGELELVVASALAKWKQRTIQRQVPSCRWKKFKGTECGYAGSETWCDRSYSRCQALGNTANFGGNRWLPSIEGRAVWWGRTQG